MLGVILAAGKATRLPNKPLLPIAGRKIAIESALEFCQARCSGTVIVDSPNKIVTDVCHTRGWVFDTVVQPQPLGVPDAIATAEMFYSEETYLITFCDNIYPQQENVIIGHASTRLLDRKQLDGCMNGHWVSRAYNPPDKLAGWYVLNSQQAQCGLPYESSIDFLNRCCVVPKLCDDNDWFDVGTIESYREYLKCCG